jgi:hypothetical protein
MRPSCPPKVGLESKKKRQKPTKDKRQKPTKDKRQKTKTNKRLFFMQKTYALHKKIEVASLP